MLGFKLIPVGEGGLWHVDQAVLQTNALRRIEK